ncbi:MAG: hypothetical protein HQ564_06690 [Candidatus Saganbacteria bacterium]|nr:hypothetical protein [Candidatus Saganbacteria bacterium]
MSFGTSVKGSKMLNKLNDVLGDKGKLPQSLKNVLSDGNKGQGIESTDKSTQTNPVDIQRGGIVV